MHKARWLTSTSGHLIERRNDLNAFALRGCLWLHDPQLLTILTHFSLQERVLLWTVKTCWHEVEVLVSIEGLHPRVTLIKTVFPCNLIAAREVVYTLEPAQIAVNVTFDNTSAPYQYHLI